jgi:hypothetical protein
VSFGFVLREAVASCALSHGSDCGCIVCRAADGDLDAFAKVAAPCWTPHGD